jgi:hypothetical protein
MRQICSLYLFIYLFYVVARENAAIQSYVRQAGRQAHTQSYVVFTTAIYLVLVRLFRIHMD